MNRTNPAERTAAYLETFLSKEGFQLLKTEYVTEDGIHYLRAYIDLTEEEREKRKAELEKQQDQKAEKETEASETEQITEAGQTGTGEEQETDGNPAEPGIGINDCALVSRRLSKWLDKEDFIPEEYMLEVCSRGYLEEAAEAPGTENQILR